MKIRNICLDCFYYGLTPLGAICEYYGTMSPFRTKCPNFKSRKEGEKQLENQVPTVKMIRNMITKLAKIKPKIKEIENQELKDELMEICLIANMLKERLNK